MREITRELGMKRIMANSSDSDVGEEDNSLLARSIGSPRPIRRYRKASVAEAKPKGSYELKSAARFSRLKPGFKSESKACQDVRPKAISKMDPVPQSLPLSRTPRQRRHGRAGSF